MNAPKPKKSPVAARDAYEAIVSLTDSFAHKHLTDEYADLCRRLAAQLSRKRPSPLSRGKPEIWAAGILHALGTVNFLFDTKQKPHVLASDIHSALGVSASAGRDKSRSIREMLGMHEFDPRWSLPSELQSNEKINRKLNRNPEHILDNAEIEFLGKQMQAMLSSDFPDVFAHRPPKAFQDILRWISVSTRCKQARESLGLSLKEAAAGAKIQQYRAKDVEELSTRSMDPVLALRYLAFLGLDKWFKRWIRVNVELAVRIGFIEDPGASETD